MYQLRSLTILALLGVTACTSSSVAQPQLWQVSYQFCIPDEISNQYDWVFARGASVDGKCVRSFQPFTIWSKDEPEVVLLFEPFPFGHSNRDRYQVAVKGNGCLEQLEVGELGYYSANHHFTINQLLTQSKALIPVVETEIEPVANITIEDRNNVPYLSMGESCQLLKQLSS